MGSSKRNSSASLFFEFIESRGLDRTFDKQFYEVYKRKSSKPSVGRKATELPYFLKDIRCRKEAKHDFESMVETWNQALGDYLSPHAATEDWIFAWRIDASSDLAEFVRAAADSQAALLKQAKIGMVIRCLLSLAFSLADHFSDIALAIWYFYGDEPGMGTISLISPILVAIVNSYFAYSGAETSFVVILSLLGLKPMLDTFRVLTDVHWADDSARITPIMSLGASRAFELAFESIPQCIIQASFMVVSIAFGKDSNVTSSSFRNVLAFKWLHCHMH